MKALAVAIVVTADTVLKEFCHPTMSGVDCDRRNSRCGPVLPRCGAVERSDVSAAC